MAILADILAKLDKMDKRFETMDKRFETMENGMNEMRSEINRVKKSRGGLIIAPRRSHVFSLGNSMDVSDIEEVPNSAYKYK